MTRNLLFTLTLAFLVFAGGASADADSNCPGDFDGDLRVTLSDFQLFVDVYGSSQGDANYNPQVDMDGNGIVNIADFLAFVEVFGQAFFGRNACFTEEDFVYIPDNNLCDAIEHHIGSFYVPSGDRVIIKRDMAKMTALFTFHSYAGGSPDVSFRGVRDLTGLEYAVNLVHLGLSDNNIQDLSPLAGLTKLTILNLDNNNIQDLSPLAGLPNLQVLYLNNNNISDLSPFANSTVMTNLKELLLNDNNISDLSPFAGMTTTLGWLWLANNNISDVTDLPRSTTNRETSGHWRYYVRLENNNITDISPLVTDNVLRPGDWINLNGNPLSSESINTHIPALISTGVSVVDYPAPP